MRSPQNITIYEYSFSMCLSHKIHIIQNFAKFWIFEQIQKINTPKFHLCPYYVPNENESHRGKADSEYKPYCKSRKVEKKISIYENSQNFQSIY